MTSEKNGMKMFEVENEIVSEVQQDNCDWLYKFDAEEQKRTLASKPWTKDPHYFKDVKVSAVALLNMVMHAKAGGNNEIMGLVQGKIIGETMVIMDAFALPVEGTETRVNAGGQANEYMVEYLNYIKEVGRLENAVGWYHSHPGYGCWLSGIDVDTQILYQKFQEPWVAFVIDPKRTISAGKVEIGAFRTYPSGYHPPEKGPSEYQTIPLAKIEDFGVHCKQYYSLCVSYFKSSLDSKLFNWLWHKYWVNTLASSSFIRNSDYVAGEILDIAKKLENAQVKLSKCSYYSELNSKKNLPEESILSKISKDSTKITTEQLKGLISLISKQILFNFHQRSQMN